MWLCSRFVVAIDAVVWWLEIGVGRWEGLAEWFVESLLFALFLFFFLLSLSLLVGTML